MRELPLKQALELVFPLPMLLEIDTIDVLYIVVLLLCTIVVL